MKATMVGLVTAALLFGVGEHAFAQGAAQGPRMFASLEFGAQTTQRTTTSSTSFSLYDETATVTTSQPVHNGPVFGGSVGYRVTPSVGVAVGVTMFNARKSESQITASIPDIFVYGQPRTVQATASDLAHSQLGVHLQAVWFHPVSDALEVVLAAGPSLIKVSHDLATATVTSGTQNITTAATSQSGTAFGFNVGGEANYRLASSYLAGIFVRYVSAQTDLTDVPKLKVGGLQAGLGLRLRF